MKQADSSLTLTTRAPDIAKQRRALLASTTRGPAISVVQFMVLCGLFDGVDTSGIGGAKANLVEAAHFGIWQTDAFRDDVAEEEFEAQENGGALLAQLDEEREQFVELADVIEELDHDAAGVILKGVAQVYADDDHSLDDHTFYARCIQVYQTMQGIS
jgi:hypothetical protein